MGRPGLRLGTSGTVRVYRTASGYRAMTRYRDWDGKIRPVERHGATKGAARSALALALRDRARADAGAQINAETRVAELGQLWFDSLADKGRSVTTLEQYRYRLDKNVIPALGQLRIRELTPGVIDRHLTAIGNEHGPSSAKMCRTVLSGMCGLATRHDALERNPVRDAGIISSKPKKAPQALSAVEVRQLRALISYHDKSVARDIPDLVGFILATGLRIGEAIAVTWDAIDLDAGTVEVRGTMSRTKNTGLFIKPRPKSKSGVRTLLMPTWCIAMLRCRAQSPDVGGQVTAFPAPLGGLRDSSNTQSDLKAAFTWAGVPWVSSHTLRKSVATMMDEAGLPARSAADQLGHSKPSMTTDVYYGRKVASTGAAAVLEEFDSAAVADA